MAFAPIVRLNDGRFALSVGVGAISNSRVFQGLNIDNSGKVFAVLDGTIAYISSGLPFDVNGRLVFSLDAPSKVTMSVPFTSSGAVSGGE